MNGCRHRRRGRKLLKLGLFVVAGAIINVAVAWGCALIASTSTSLTITNRTIPGDHLVWPSYIRQAGWPGPHAGCHFRQGLGIDHWYFESLLSEDLSLYLDVYECGWPWRCLTHHLMYPVGASMAGYPASSPLDAADPFLARADAEGKLYRGIVIRRSSGHPMRLPVVTLWPGFAINTIFYATIVGMLFAAPGQVCRFRRWWRIKRGLCPACAYPVGASPICTECGGPISGGVSR